MASADAAAAAAALVEELSALDPFCPAPPEEATVLPWPEQRIRAFFDAGGVDGGSAQPRILSHDEVLSKYPPPAEDEFRKWFPGLGRSKTACSTPCMRLVCFTNAGNEENVFTNEGLGARRVSALLDWCRSSQVELLAVQLPGRGTRAQEPFLPDTQTAAAKALAMLASRLCDAPYCVLAHSVGTWIAFEMLSLAREQGLPLPLKVFFSCFPSPDTTERPWTPQRMLDDAAFKVECRGWDVSDALLKDAGMWANYVGLMRADFKLFDEYAFRRVDAPPFAFSITAFVATHDKKVSAQLVKGWSRFTSAGFEMHELSGHHLFVLAMGDQRDVKHAWLAAVVAELKLLIEM